MLKNKISCQECAKPPERLSQPGCAGFSFMKTRSFPVGQLEPADTLCTLAQIVQPTPTFWQAKTEGVAALHLGCPNASSEALEQGTCFWTQVLLRPKLHQSPFSSSSPLKAIRLLHPLCSQQKAEGRGKAWLCWMSPSGNDSLCASNQTPTRQKRLWYAWGKICTTNIIWPSLWNKLRLKILRFSQSSNITEVQITQSVQLCKASDSSKWNCINRNRGWVMEEDVDSCQSPCTVKNTSWPLLPCCRQWNNDSLCGPSVEFQMGVRNEVVQSAGKGQVHADLLSLAVSIPFFPVSLYTLQPPPPPGYWGNQGKGCYFCCHKWPRLNIQLKKSLPSPFLPTPPFPPWIVVVEVLWCNLIRPANSTVMSRTASDKCGGEVAAGHYLSIFPSQWQCGLGREAAKSKEN